MRNILVGSALFLAWTGAAFAQSASHETGYNVVVEPVRPTIEGRLSAPVEYTKDGVAKAQYFKASDLSPEEYQALLAEADRIRAYQSNSSPTYTASPVQAQTPVAAYGAAPVSAPAPTAAYEIELFEPETRPTQITETVAVEGGFAQYRVVKGDTLYNISKRYNITVEALQAANALSGSALSIDQSLNIPSRPAQAVQTIQTSQSEVSEAALIGKPVQVSYSTRRVIHPVPMSETDSALASTTSTSAQNYAVLPKDTLYSISRRSCVGVSDLINANNLENPNRLKPGQTLKVPAGHCLPR